MKNSRMLHPYSNNFTHKRFFLCTQALSINNVATDGAARAMKKSRFHTLPSRDRGKTKLKFVANRYKSQIYLLSLQMHCGRCPSRFNERMVQ